MGPLAGWRRDSHRDRCQKSRTMYTSSRNRSLLAAPRDTGSVQKVRKSTRQDDAGTLRPLRGIQSSDFLARPPPPRCFVRRNTVKRGERIPRGQSITGSGAWWMGRLVDGAGVRWAARAPCWRRASEKNRERDASDDDRKSLRPNLPERGSERDTPGYAEGALTPGSLERDRKRSVSRPTPMGGACARFPRGAPATFRARSGILCGTGP